jgi:heptosyltransferase-2
VIRRIAVFVPNWVGDATMATPTLRALRRHYGSDAEIVGIMKPTIAEVLQGTDWLNEVWHYDRQSSDARLRPRALLSRLRRKQFDVSVHLTNDFLSALLVTLGGVRERVGYDRYRRGWLLTLALQPARNGQMFTPIPALDYYLQIAYAIGCPEESPRMELAVSPEDEQSAERIWRSFGLEPDAPVVLLNSSGAYGAAKLWPDDYFGALAARIASQLDYPVVVLCGYDEQERSAGIAALASHPRVFSLAGNPLSIGLSKACVRRGRCLISTDSGPRHLGAAFNIPVVAIFGPTDIRWSDTHYPGETRLQLAVDCGPCGQRVCPLGHHRCMQDLTVDMVFAAVSRILSGEIRR